MLVGSLLTALTLAVLQFGLAVYVRNVVHDAAVEGAYRAALADTPTSAGASRTAELISATVGDGFAQEVVAAETRRAGQPVIEVTVSGTLPLVGLLGIPWGLEVTGHAPVESLE